MEILTTEYAEPVSKLLTYGESRAAEWPNYLDLGLTREHVPELVRMGLDEDLNWADSDSLEVWAPIHAWRALGQLKAEEAIEPLMTLFHELEDSDWVTEELPEVYGMIGPAAIPPLASYLATAAHGLDPRTTAASSLAEIGKRHPEARGEVICALTRQLERYAYNHPDLNGFLVLDLARLKAVEAMPVIRGAFEKEKVDYTIIGDVEDVEIEMGLRTERATPANYPGLRERYFPFLAQPAPAAAEKKKKVGRNDPCPCGSGKKYKKCCLNK